MKNKRMFYKDMIVNSIDLSDYGINTDGMSIKEQLQEVYKTFRSEYDHEIKRYGKYQAFESWLRGLPTCLTPDCFYDSDILSLAKEYGFVLDTERKEDKFLNEYWTKLMRAFYNLID